MSWLSKIAAIARSRKLECDLDEELQFHIEQKTQENIAAGMPSEEARHAALRSFGGVEQKKEECRDADRLRWLEDVIQDLRYGLRQLRRNPGFTAVAVLTLAIGIGASTTIFSVVDAVLLSPLPYPNPQNLVRVWEAREGHRMQLADPNFDDFHSRNHTLSALAEYADLPLPVAGTSEPARVRVAIVSRDFFKAIGVQPFMGRAFAPEELHLGGARAAIVSYGFWERYLGGSRDVRRLQLTMNGGVYPVVGVMPQGFDFPRGTSLWVAREAYPQSSSRTAHSWNCIGRIRNGFSVAQARADLGSIAQQIHVQHAGEQYLLKGAAVVPLADALVGSVRAAVLTVFGTVMLLFLVACANVAGLLLARMALRKKELAVRAALGAGRGRLVRQMLAESLVLADAGGLLGVLVAIWATNLLPVIAPADLPSQHAIAINATVLLFTVGATVAVAVGLGLFAAWRAGSADVNEALGAGSRSYTTGSQRLRSVLVIGEIAATLMMLVGTALLGRSFLDLISVSPGFSGENLLVAKVSRPPSETSLNLTFAPQGRQEIARRVRFFDGAVSRLLAIPGVKSAAVTGGLPIADPDGFPDGLFLILNGQPSPENWHDWGLFALNRKQTGEADYCAVGAGFFRTLGIPLIRGRLFDAHDGPGTLNVAVISKTLAKKQWPNENPIGQVLNFGNMDGNLRPLTIVGVVGDIRAEGLDRPSSPVIYVDYRQRGFSINTSPAIVLRTSLASQEIIPEARQILHEINPNVPVQFSTFAEALGGWMAERRFLLMLAGVFAGAALTLAAMGIYGVVAHSVTQRRNEIGIRMALGAQRDDVLQMVVGQGFKLALTGVAIGIAGALALTRFLSSLLYGVKPTDPLTFIVVSIVLIAVALVACYIPARRAAKVDPIVALRYE